MDRGEEPGGEHRAGSISRVQARAQAAVLPCDALQHADGVQAANGCACGLGVAQVFLSWFIHMCQLDGRYRAPHH